MEDRRMEDRRMEDRKMEDRGRTCSRSKGELNPHLLHTCMCVKRHTLTTRLVSTPEEVMDEINCRP